MVTNVINISQINMEGLIGDMREEEATRLLKIAIENNPKILELQKY